MKKRCKTVLIAAGGTGGHVFPALAVAQALQKQGISVGWVGTAHGLETKVVPTCGFPLFLIHASALRGKGRLRVLWVPFLIFFAFIESVFLILKKRPAVVLGMGGYVSGPVGVAAFLLRVPLVIQEQNRIAGFTNHHLAKIATRTLTGFPNTFPQNGKTFWTGNPIRSEIVQTWKGVRHITPFDKPLQLLILGGSLGAHVFNQTVPAAVALLNLEVRPLIWHQTGAREKGSVQAAYQESRVQARAEAFIHDMAEAYRWADLVICRAGALTISELTIAGVGAVLVPFPYATDDHQTCNAQYLSEAQAAILLPQSQLTPGRLSDLLFHLHQNRDELKRMGEKSAALARIDATDEVVKVVLSFL